MSTTLANWMTLILAIIIMFTPILAYADSLNQSAMREVVYESAKKASVEGYFTDDIIESMEKTLVDHYNFDLSQIDIEVTETVTYRPNLNSTITDNDYITATVTFPRIPIFLFLFSDEPDEHVVHIELLSEYIG